MEIIAIAFITALGYLILLGKLLGIDLLLRSQLLWDFAVTLGLPVLFLGTFSGMATAFLAGVMFSCMTFVLSLAHTPPKPPNKIRL